MVGIMGDNSLKQVIFTMKKQLLLVILISIPLLTGCSTVEYQINKIEFNQQSATAKLLSISVNQADHLKRTGRFAKAEEMNWANKEFEGYLIEMKSNPTSFQCWATPTKYGMTGKLSFYTDNTDGNIHGEDKNGEKVSVESPVVATIAEEYRQILINKK